VLFRSVLIGLIGQRNFEKGKHAIPERERIDHRHIGADNARFAQIPDATQTSWLGDMHLLCQRTRRHLVVPLQQVEQLAVDFIKDKKFWHIKIVESSKKPHKNSLLTVFYVVPSACSGF